MPCSGPFRCCASALRHIWRDGPSGVIITSQAGHFLGVTLGAAGAASPSVVASATCASSFLVPARGPFFGWRWRVSRVWGAAAQSASQGQGGGDGGCQCPGCGPCPGEAAEAHGAGDGDDGYGEGSGGRDGGGGSAPDGCAGGGGGGSELRNALASAAALRRRRGGACCTRPPSSANATSQSSLLSPDLRPCRKAVSSCCIRARRRPALC